MMNTDQCSTAMRLDPVDLAVSQGHEAAIDLLGAIAQAQTVTRALEIREQLSVLIQTFQHVEHAALNRADDL